jgi:mono/diheme cytochrome c family protein
MRAALIRLVAVCLIAAAASFDLGQTTAPTSQGSHDAKVQSATVSDGVHTITLPPIASPEMPEGPQKDLFTANCILCHTPRYVTMQPAFPRKTWQAEVEKMKKVYGAPIADDQMPHIVDYLVSIRGK